MTSKSWPRLILTTLFVISAFATNTPVYAGGGGCHSQAATEGAGVTVEIKDACFNPTVLHVQPGQKVTWINRDPYAHTVTGTASSFGDYGSIEQDKSVSYKFTANGVYSYYCALHPGMAAAIVVGDASGRGPATDGSTVIPLAPAPTAAKTTVVSPNPSTGALAASSLVALLLGAAGGYLGAWLPRRKRA